MRIPTLITFNQYSIVVSKQKNKKRKINKIINIGNEKGKLVICICYNCTYGKSKHIYKLLEQKSQVSKFDDRNIVKNQLCSCKVATTTKINL